MTKLFTPMSPVFGLELRNLFLSSTKSREFETYSILELEKGKTYIANGFITSVYGLK